MNGAVVSIDTGIADYQHLAAGVSPGADVVLLDSWRDGVNQISQYLAGRSGLDSIHVVSHGSAGALYLGSGVLDSHSLQWYATDLQAISRSLGVNGDILL